MHVVAWIIGTPVLIMVMIWLFSTTHGYQRHSPRYHYCSANHRHQTPAAARRCSAAQHH